MKNEKTVKTGEYGEQQVRQDLFDIKEHGRLVESIVKTLTNTEYNLDLFKKCDEAYKDTPSLRKEAKQNLKNLLNHNFQYLDLIEQSNYIQTFGPFYRLYFHVKHRFEAEVLNQPTK